MKVVFTEAAARDLDDILLCLTRHHPAQADAVAHRIDSVLDHLTRWRKQRDPSRSGGRFE
jgi:plasmid stabilization system protein ParE